MAWAGMAVLVAPFHPIQCNGTVDEKYMNEMQLLHYKQPVVSISEPRWISIFLSIHTALIV
jgi:hypothetical protein